MCQLLSELREEKQMHRRKLNQKHCKAYRKRRESSAAKQSILGQETGQSRYNKSQEDDHVLLDTISATLYFSAWQMFKVIITLCLLLICAQ